MQTQTIYTSNQLLSICNAEQTQTNICIAQTIINMYMQAKTFFQSDMIECFDTFLVTGILDFAKYKIQF
jgi:hypothetical protein